MSHRVGGILLQATQLLSQSNSPKLDAELLLAAVLKTTRTYFISHPEREITPTEFSEFTALLKQRQEGKPIAYLIGHKEFWSLDLVVTPDTLIPRPETELLVEQVLKKITGKKKYIADLGTGSGAIALALAKEHPDWIIHATDISPDALDIAKLNAERLHISNVTFFQGDWCNALPEQTYDVIVSNPPYVAEEELPLMSPGVAFEPQAALFSKDQGLADLRKIINSAHSYLKPKGLLFLEHGFQQACAIQSIFTQMGYTEVTVYKDLAGLDRITTARW